MSHLFLADIRLRILEDILEPIARSAEIHLHFVVSSMPLHMFALCALGWEESMVRLWLVAGLLGAFPNRIPFQGTMRFRWIPHTVNTVTQ